MCKIEDIVSVSSGILLGKMDGVYEVMSHLAGRPVFTHEIPVLSDRARAAIFAEYPQLETEEAPAGQPDKIPAYIEELRRKYGEELPLSASISTEGSHKLLEGKTVIAVQTK